MGFTKMMHLFYLLLLFESAETCPQICECLKGESIVNCDRRNITTEQLSDILRHIDAKNTTKISLSWNRLISVPIELFANFTQLEYLILDHNNIGRPPENVSLLLPKLATLSLTANRVGELDERSFVGYQKLEVLFLKQNAIMSIANNTFQNIDNLRELFLNENLLQELNESTFRGLTNVRHLLLNNNRLVYIHPRAFRHTPKVVDLYLHNNHLKEIDGALFSGLQHVEMLMLNGNEITSIADSAFENATVNELYLNKNKLTELPMQALSRAKIRRVHVNKNPLHCSCRNYIDYVTHVETAKAIVSLGTCQTPIEYNGIPLTSFRNCTICDRKPCQDGLICKANQATSFKCIAPSIATINEIAKNETAKTEKFNKNETAKNETIESGGNNKSANKTENNAKKISKPPPTIDDTNKTDAEWQLRESARLEGEVMIWVMLGVLAFIVALVLVVTLVNSRRRSRKFHVPQTSCNQRLVV